MSRALTTALKTDHVALMIELHDGRLSVEVSFTEGGKRRWWIASVLDDGDKTAIAAAPQATLAEALANLEDLCRARHEEILRDMKADEAAGGES